MCGPRPQARASEERRRRGVAQRAKALICWRRVCSCACLARKFLYAGSAILPRASRP